MVLKGTQRDLLQSDAFDEVLTADEAARLLKLSKKTLLRLARDGTIPGNKIGRVWRFRRSQLLDILSARRAV
ncbi:MAG: helix-turn-helix domain-containing protein [Actinomycetota bacterium]